jgi:hypothetical protein
MLSAFVTDLLSGLASKLLDGLLSWVNQKQLAEQASKAESLQRQMQSIGEAARREKAIHEAVTGVKAKPPLTIEEWNANAP